MARISPNSIGRRVSIRILLGRAFSGLLAVVSMALIGATIMGCQTHAAAPNRPAIGGLQFAVADVVVESLTEAPDSPGHGYPLLTPMAGLFPLELERAGVAGSVDVRILVGANGRVKKATVVRSSQKEFESPALAGVAHWKFQPFLAPGEKVPQDMIFDCRIRFDFAAE